MHGASHGGHQQWSADVLMEGLAAARSSSEQPPTAAAEPRDRSSRKRSHAGGASTSLDKRHAAAPAGADVPARAAGADDPFELNVGGRVFTTRRSTLTMEDGSMLANLFAEGSAFDEIDRDPNGRAFLDRDGDSFAVVLDYLRRSGRLAGKHSADMLSRVREDAEYFGLAGLVTAIDAHVEAVEAERVRVEEAADAKRLAETVSAEERQGAREAQLRQAKCCAGGKGVCTAHAPACHDARSGPSGAAAAPLRRPLCAWAVDQSLNLDRSIDRSKAYVNLWFDW